MLPHYLNEKVEYISDTHNINTRNRNNFKLPRINSELAKKNVYYDGLKMYNELPNIVKNSVTLTEFKRKCIEYIKEKYEPL